MLGEGAAVVLEVFFMERQREYGSGRQTLKKCPEVIFYEFLLNFAAPLRSLRVKIGIWGFRILKRNKNTKITDPRAHGGETDTDCTEN